MAAHIDNLIERIADESLRSQLAEEVAKLTAAKTFGLVFQRHLPEDIEVPGIRPRTGDIVRLRGDETKQNHVVELASSEIATIKKIDATRSPVADAPSDTHPFESLVVVKDFDAPIYPGLRLLGEIQKDADKPTHLVVEGENYYVLETLLYTHEGSVDLIYIDPPYNTGTAAWMYNDRYIDSGDRYQRSRWLAFMERRLEHAKRLLKPSGFILVSIDDNEQHRLRMLLDQVFGERNFVATFAWKSDGNIDNQAEIKINHEYVHMYAADKDNLEIAGVRDPNIDESSKLNNAEIRNSVVKNGDKNPKSNIVLPVGFPANFDEGTIKGRTDKWPNYDADLMVKDGTLLNSVTAYTGWANASLLKSFIAGGFHPVTDTKGQDTVFELTETGAIDNVKVRREGQHHILTVLMNLGTTEKSGNHVKAMGLDFPYPKPLELLEYLVSFAGPKAIVVDYFAGSGTTAEAVFRLNAADGGIRQSISVTNNELSQSKSSKLKQAGHLPGDAEYEASGVFQSVTKPRIETAVTGVKPDGSTFSDGFAENVSFYSLTFEDENLVALGRKFEAVAPLLWMKAGGRGPVVRREGSEGWSMPVGSTYGILFDTSAAKSLATAIAERDSALAHIYIVTDSAVAFQTAVGYLPLEYRINTTRLYSDYLRSFEINGRD